MPARSKTVLVRAALFELRYLRPHPACWMVNQVGGLKSQPVITRPHPACRMVNQVALARAALRWIGPPVNLIRRF